MNIEAPRGMKAKQERNKKVLQMRAQGYSYSQIAKEFELTPQGIQWIIKHTKEQNA